ncbi:hypothetical protein B0I37DRAFT_364320 [Chaetomium sp. MPI-CAGE-AT-0009]|nr:hypothetical protein B0I37DRAFT_364320 [Chaetomium sp. MPI-CAGE-AT-0009]
MSSSRLGLRARELLSVRVTGSASTVPFLTSRPSFRARGLPLPWASSFSTSQARPNRELSQAIEASMPRVEEQGSPSLESRQRMQNGGMNEALAETISMILPGTFILPPLSQFPKPLGQKFRLLRNWFVVKVQETVMNATVRFSSKPGFFKLAALKYKKSTLIPTAKALHRSMLQALATGDRLAINKTCARKLGMSLLVSIDARPRGRRYSWELVEYTKKLFYPRIKSHKLSPLGRERSAPILRQMVVAISSKQRKGVYDIEGRVIPGSEKEIDVVEHVVISCIVDPKNGYAQQPWRVIGTTSPTTVESWAKEKEIMKMMLQQ